MHVAFAVATLIASWKFANWRQWRQHQATMLYMFACAMLYEFLTKEHPLWKFNPDILINQQQIVLLYAVVTMPLTVLMFLSNYPDGLWRRVCHYVMWIGIYVFGELILYAFRRITYRHGWDIWWSILFDIVMFPMLRLHYKKPEIAYLLSLPIVVLYMLVMGVPFK